jgi:hypothetical protein
MTYRSDLDALDARHNVLANELTQKTRELDQATKLLEDAKARAKLPILDNIRIAKPCRADWTAMIGDDRMRHCNQCDKKVFNLSEMTRAEAEALIVEKNGKLCARYYRRSDGTIMTSDCRAGIIAARKLKVVAVASLALLGTGIGIAVQRHNRVELDGIDSWSPPATSEPIAAGRLAERANNDAPPKPVEPPKSVEIPSPVMGGVSAPLMGDIE